MIKHNVIFKLKYAKGSVEEKNFMKKTLVLGTIPGAKNFERFSLLNKQDYSYGFSMEFKTQADYDAYGQHPIHVAFVEDHWNTGVEDYLVIGHTPYTN